MNPLRKVSDGIRVHMSAAQLGQEIAPTAIWSGLALGVWGGSPEVQPPLWIAGFGLALAFWIAGRREDAPDQPAPGVWRTSRKAQLEARWKNRIPFAGLAIALLLTGQSWWYGDLWGVIYAMALNLGFGWLIWRRPPLEPAAVELRIDEAGIYDRGLGWTIPWAAIQAVRPRSRDRRGKLGLRLGPSDLPNLSLADRTVGTDIEIDLAPMAVGVDTIRAEIFKHRPDLEAAPPADLPGGLIVAPIVGAATESDERDETALGAVGVILIAQNPAILLTLGGSE
ncbi:hypothetical protein DDF62_06830 [Caulobacter radicis]|uniref:hypothetical protein n=1 Tax=Caulobacter radicis TaxID=2172650 RepID=UPI000D57607C|nr:hypothetical protein [Caulobacter radicis]PVM91734.1 hypothetical protein DDF62_06830 [Caulobacter radicis]